MMAPKLNSRGFPARYRYERIGSDELLVSLEDVELGVIQHAWRRRGGTGWLPEDAGSGAATTTKHEAAKTLFLRRAAERGLTYPWREW